ncbi:MAG: DUF421 domain-containing protein [Oscillospiraceae bacterium]|nr:DUF421 domain-containing protein [Oscillospiraceae bacterium]
MSIVLIRAAILYITVVFAVRLMGKRQLGELQPSELVITILVSNIATLVLEDLNIPLAVGVAPVLALVCFEVIMSWVTLKFPKVRCIVSGRPKIIISDGKLDREVMKSLRYSVDDLMTSLRGNDIFSLEEVQYAIVETTGSLSVMKKPEYDTPARKDLNLNPKAVDPPQVIIADGKLLEKALETMNLTKYWLDRILKKKQIRVKDIFIMTADRTGKYYIVENNHTGRENPR